MPGRIGINYAILSIVIDIVGTVAAVLLAAWLRTTLPWGYSLVGGTGLHLDFLLWAAPPVWLMIALASSLYDPSRNYKAVDEFQNVVLTVLFFGLAMAGLVYFTERTLSRLMLVYFALSQGLVLVTWRAVAHLLLRVLNGRAYAMRRVLIVGAGEVGLRIAEMIRAHRWTGLDLVGYLDDDPLKRDNGLRVLGTIDEVRQVVERDGIEEVVVALPPQAYGKLNQLVVDLHEMPVRVRVVPDYFSLALYRATAADFGGVPMISLRDPALNDVQRMVKRLFDLIVGSVLFILSLPIMAVVALAIKLDSAGPVLFLQQRVGENGKLFTMYKFRSMIVEAEKLQAQVNLVTPEGHIVHKVQGDPRVTRVGRVIRKFSLDELPQLLNVLRGDLSLVGPRPELPWLVEMYEPWQRKRFAVPQGVTGWWQVNGRSDKPMHLHTEDDLYYIQNYSLWLDITILWKTLWVALRGRGAY